MYNFILCLNFSVLDLCYLMAERGSENVVSKEIVSSLYILFLQLSLFSMAYFLTCYTFMISGLCVSHTVGKSILVCTPTSRFKCC